MTLAIGCEAPCPSLDRKRLERAAEAVLRSELGAAPPVSLVLLDDAAMARLNQTWLGHDGPTDVLTFPLRADGDPDEVPLGEIAVSLETAAAQAADHPGWSLADELELLLVHGLLHLCGWDDGEAEERKAMQQREDELLIALGGRPAPRGEARP